MSKKKNGAPQKRTPESPPLKFKFNQAQNKTITKNPFCHNRKEKKNPLLLPLKKVKLGFR